MADINLNNLDGIPFGIDSGRPTNPQPGQPYFNGQSNRLEIYTQSVGWQNIVQETPAVVNVVGAANENASSTITINGTNFSVGCMAYAVGTNGVETVATSTSLISVVQLTAVFPALSPTYEPYDIKVVNPSNLYGVLYDCLTVDNIPAWTTASGSLGTYTELSPMSVTVTAVDPVDSLSSPLIYSIASGSLPGGLSINASTGVISGTPTDVIPNTTYSFTAAAYDGRNTAVTRNFSITITDRGPSWTTTATLPTFTRNSAYSTTLVATDDNGIASYSLFSGSLPTGLTLNGTTGVISGTPTSSSPATFTIRATDNGGNYVDRQFTMPNVGPVWVSSGTITLESNGTFQLSATDDSGINPTYSIASGSLPSGVSLSSAGLLSSSSTAASSTTINLRVSDQHNNTADRSFTLVLVPYIFTSHTFTSGGTTGADGPSIGTLRSAYSSQSWAQNNSFLTMSTNGIQRWMAPQAGTYRIESAGAPGSRSGITGGSGGIVRGDFSLSAGQYLNILVGQRGIKVNGGSDDSQPGGGGSFVWDDSNNPLVIGGGGGGAINQSTVSNSSASTNLDGVNPAGNSGGGSPTTYSSDYSQSGAGWLQNSSTSGIADTIPYRPLEGGRGGTYSGAGSHGGFGGGGCQTNSGSNRGGGGGGYTGGQGGSQSQLTVAGANFVSSSATNRTWVGSRGTEHASGYVTITKL